MQTALDFFTLNGYGVYVWPAFGFAAAVLAAMGWRVASRLRAAESALAAAQARRGTDRP